MAPSKSQPVTSMLPLKDQLLGQIKDAVKEFKQNQMDSQFQWLAEIQDTIERELKHNTGLNLLPKTPSEKKKGGRPRKPTVTDEHDQTTTTNKTSTRRKLNTDDTLSSTADQSGLSEAGTSRMTRMTRSKIRVDDSFKVPAPPVSKKRQASSAQAEASPGDMFSDEASPKSKQPRKSKRSCKPSERVIESEVNNNKQKRVEDESMDNEERDEVSEIPEIDRSNMGPSEQRLAGVRRSRKSSNARRSSQLLTRAKATLTLKDMKNEVVVQTIKENKAKKQASKEKSSDEEPPADPPMLAPVQPRQMLVNNDMIVVSTPRKSPMKHVSPIKKKCSKGRPPPLPVSPIKAHTPRAPSPATPPMTRRQTRTTKQTMTPAKASKSGESPVPSPPRHKPPVGSPRSPRIFRHDSQSPHPDARALYKTRMTPQSMVKKVNSFLNRNTPKKTSQKEQQEIATEKLRKQEEREAEAKIRKEKTVQEKAEAARKKREARAQRVATMKVKQAQKEHDKNKKQRDKQVAAAQAKHDQLEEKKVPPPKKPLKAIADVDSDGASDSESSKPGYIQKMVQKEEQQRKVEKERENQRIQREKAEMERLKAKQLQMENELKAEREKERLHVLAEQKKREMEDQQQKELSAAIKKQNKLASTGNEKPNATFNASKNASTINLNNSHSYDMTPLRKMQPSTAMNYNIDDIRSSDETDDEDNPRKMIPTWAQGAALKASLINQYYKPPDLDSMFGVCIMPDLTKIFAIQRKRFRIRTSSAHWKSPIMPLRHNERPAA